MKSLSIKLATSIAATSALALASVAQANIIYSVTGPGVGISQNAEQAFFGSLSPGTVITETFENDQGFSGYDQSKTFNTSVGTFTASGAAVGQSCGFGDFNCGKGMGIVDQAIMAASPGGTDSYWGRFPLPQDANNNQYLDSLDHEFITLEINSGYNALGFFLTDPNDSGGTLDIFVKGTNAFSKTIDDILGGPQKNKGAFYLSFLSTAGDISSVTFTKNNTSDGVGFDNVSIGVAVPEPGTLALLGLGLAGLGIARRRKQA